jgi:hypothetical protein
MSAMHKVESISGPLFLISVRAGAAGLLLNDPLRGRHRDARAALQRLRALSFGGSGPPFWVAFSLLVSPGRMRVEKTINQEATTEPSRQSLADAAV